jgi:HD-like signal output (HDOD) protein
MKLDYVPAFTLQPLKREVQVVEADALRTPSFINDVAGGRVELPTIPAVVQRLIAALRDPDVNSRTIGEELARDPVLTSKVLRLANSSFFGGQRSMASIDAAVSLIGTAALNRLIVACGVSSSFAAVPGIDLGLFWREAVLAASAAQKLAPRLEADPEEAYLCGLLHATGHLILCRSYPEIANAMFTGFAPVRGAELCEIELGAFGIDHPEVGALWVESIKFPQPVAEAIGKSARPPDPSDGPLDVVLQGACALAAAALQELDVEAAWAALPERVRAPFGAAGGAPDAAFTKLYEGLLETEVAV